MIRTASDVREALKNAKLASWAFAWSLDEDQRAKVTVYPADSFFTRTQLEALVFSFGANGARVETVAAEDPSPHAGICIHLEFKQEPAVQAVCAACNYPTQRCRCIPY
jgi:hypothetical protein